MSLITTIRLTASARRLVHDAQAMHRTIAHTLDQRGLWAIPDPRTLIIRHPDPITWHTAMEGVIAHSHTVVAPTHQDGERISWALIANPTKAEPVRGRRGTIRPLPPEAWADWMDRKLAPAMIIDSIEHQPMRTAIGIKPDRKITHRRVCFTGTATVRDADALTTLADTGIGRGKAYGCGLLVTRSAA